MLNRQILNKIWQNINNDFILLLNGPRQSGKTTLLNMIQQKLINEYRVKPEQIHYYDLEKTENLAIWSNQSAVLKILPKNNEQKHYIFIDEFQKSPQIGSILKYIHDHYRHIKLVVTGSASWYLNINESMAGRKLVFKILPLSFVEYLEWKDKKELLALCQSKDDKILNDAGLINLINEQLLDFITFGGYPAVVLAEQREQKAEMLAELINAYILKDIQLWNYAANSLQVRKLLAVLASQIGSTLSIENLSIQSGLGRTALKNRLELLQNTFILINNAPYFTNKLKELVKSPKTYLVDTGLRNALLNNFALQPQTNDFGALAENFVVTELYKQGDVFTNINYWRTKTGQEVDIIKKQEGRLVPIEIKSGSWTKIPAGLKSFINQYAPPEAYVLNWDVVKDIKFKKTIIKFRPLWYRV